MSSFRCKRWDVEEAHESGGGRRCSLRSRWRWQVAHFVELMSELAFWGHLVSGLEATVLGSGVKSVKRMRRVLERVRLTSVMKSWGRQKKEWEIQAKKWKPERGGIKWGIRTKKWGYRSRSQVIGEQ